MTDFLQLPYLKTLSFQDKGHYYHVFATGTITPSGCPSCTSDIYRHGKERQKYVDSPVRGNPVIIEIERQRFRCKACGKAFYETLPDMHEKRLTTKRLVHYVERRALNQTFASLSNEVGLDEKSVKNIFSDHVKTLKHQARYETPSILGIDEVKCSGEFRCILTNIEECSAFEFLDSLNEEKLGQYFETLPNKNQISTVVMDTSDHFKRMVQRYLPGRVIVADRFHVTKIANDALEQIRRKVWQHLDLETKSAFKTC